MKPKFSILIPTRERHDTLHFSILSVIEQSFSDFELIISDNLSSPPTKACVEKFNDSRIKYYRTPDRLAMSDNWEFGLGKCSGDYVFVLGDDDALIPNALNEAASIIAAEPNKIVSWNRASYFWPSAILKPSRHQMELPFGNGRLILKSAQILANVYSFAQPYFYLPMIYSSFVPRAVIDKVRAKNSGNYFYGRAPDICSGIANATVVEEYIHSQIPLSIAGVSGHSTGLAQGYQGLGSDAHKKLLAEGKENAERPKLHSQLIDSSHQYFLIADDLLKLRDRFSIPLEFNPNKLIEWVAGSLWADSSRYDDYVQDLIAFASKHNIDVSGLRVPGKTEMPDRYPSLFSRTPNDPLRECYHTIDCSNFGIADVWEAAKLLAKLLPNYANGIAGGWRDRRAVPAVQPKNWTREELLNRISESSIDQIKNIIGDMGFMSSYLPFTRRQDSAFTKNAESAGIVAKLGDLLETNDAVAGLMGLMLLYPPKDLSVSDLADIPEWFRSLYLEFIRSECNRNDAQAATALLS